MMMLLSVSILLALLSPALADYTCFCSYATDTILYSQQSTTSNIIGHMYEFDCKPEYTDASLTAGWKAVMIDHHVGYFQKVSAVSSEICQGSIPSEDKVTTGPLTTPTTPTSTTTSTTKSVPTSSINRATTVASLPSSTSSPTSSTLGKVSNVPSSSLKTTAASSSQSASSTKIPTSASKLPTASTTSRQTQSSSTSTSTTSIPSMVPSTPVPSTSTKITTQKITTTTRKTRTQPPPTTHRYMHAPFVTQPPKTTYKCPDNVLGAAVHNQGFTRVYGSTCYELIPHHYYHWYDAEANCKHKGGHLVHVQNMAEENNVMRFLFDRGFRHAVWIGLTDLHSENYFHWTSGDPVTFTKWMPGHVGNFANHHNEDCVVLVPYIKAGFFGSHGLWDDIPCNDVRPWICQYDAQPVHSLSSHIFGPGFFNHGHTTKSNHIVFTTKTPVIGGLAQVLDIVGKK